MQQLQLHIQEGRDERQTLFCDVLLPVPVPKYFTYRVPYALNDSLMPGCRVVVQFGKKKILTGIVAEVHDRVPEAYDARYLLEQLDEQPVVQPLQLRLFQWMADYYMCTPGEVLNVALPSGLKLSSQSQVQLHPDFSFATTEHSFNEKELLLLQSLQAQDHLSYADVEKLLGQKSLYQLFKNLLAKEAILLYEQVKDKYKPKTVRRVRLQPGLVQDTASLEALFKALESHPKQADVLLKYLREVPVLKEPGRNEKGLAKSELVDAQISPSSVRTLVKNGILEEFEEAVPRFWIPEADANVDIHLTGEQQGARQQILDHFEDKDTVLLHGITGSGKTELYISLIREALDNGSQVLYLLPEIALTTQIVGRLKKVFGGQMGVYHSRFSDNERVEVWQGVLNGSFPLVVGVRSSIFLPFHNLGLIIVDEEHETSYKQYDPAPRYHARDTALVLARMHGGKTLLGSATPSIETYYQAEQGKFGLVQLHKRYGEAQLPQLELADTRLALKQKTMKAMFTPALVDGLKLVVERKEQAIVFQNRRGYAPYINCEECSWIPKCQNCAVSLTYHLRVNELRCHYCGLVEYVPTACPACGSHKIKTVGYGTEKLEESLRLLIPEATVERMDLDTTRRKNSFQVLLDDFGDHKIDILVGTQMVSKGLDFEGVTLVGIFDADRMIHYPDFRSHERTYQLVTQVAGRAGRSSKPGRVIIQTSNTELPLLHTILVADYLGLYKTEIDERRQYFYPPFSRLIRLVVRHSEKELTETAAKALAERLRSKLGVERVLGPEEPLVGRIRGLYLMHITLKLERQGLDVPAVKQYLLEQSQQLVSEKAFKGVEVVPDVDPY
ncbi:replication restart helicase PriA [Cesiribacter andamanensis]|uniref:Replication restart protein PriA n=1 Tax=Cesiribacter andamanensis AMV16 TaxID=1279009 RepID=M7MX28_9BACT|nr:primosomal protein N' [Cesiribacter andamanensis]EMR00983.1 Primosomal protein N' [Cesiribacter andamanensis AMV16]